MTELKGFESMYEDVPTKDTDIPLPGTYAHLRWVAEQKRIQKVKIKESDPVDKDLLIDDQTTSRKEPHALRESHALKKAASLKEGVQTASLKEGRSLREVHPQREIDDGLVRIVYNFCFFDKDLFRIFRELKEGELRIYLGLYMRSYARKHPKNICSCTNSELSETTGITSSSAFSRAFKGLESRGLIKRLLTSRSLNEKSLFRVFLPCEIRGIKSSTEIKYLTEDEPLP